MTGSSAGREGGQFQSTRWTNVLLSAQSQTPSAKEAREELCRLYWYPLYAFVRSRGYNPEDARDLTQGFFLALFDRKALRAVTPLKGKFRSYLLACLRHYLSVEFHRENAIKRGGRIEFVSLDLKGAEERYIGEPIDSVTPDKAFDAQWASTLLGHATDRLERLYRAQGNAVVFDTLKPLIDPNSDEESPPYEAVAIKLRVSIGSAKTLVRRFRKRYIEIVREAVAETVTDSADINPEIRALCDALVARGRLGA